MTCQLLIKVGMAQLLAQKDSLAYKGKPALISSVLNTVGHVVCWFCICELDLWTITVVQVVWTHWGGNYCSLVVQQGPLRLWWCCLHWCSKGYDYRNTKLLKAIDLKKAFPMARTVGSNGLPQHLWNIFPQKQFWMLFVNRCSAGILFPVLRISTHFIFWGVLMFLHLLFNKARKCGRNWKLDIVYKPLSTHYKNSSFKSSYKLSFKRDY